MPQEHLVCLATRGDGPLEPEQHRITRLSAVLLKNGKQPAGEFDKNLPNKANFRQTYLDMVAWIKAAIDKNDTYVLVSFNEDDYLTVIKQKMKMAMLGNHLGAVIDVKEVLDSNNEEKTLQELYKEITGIDASEGAIDDSTMEARMLSECVQNEQFFNKYLKNAVKQM